MQKGPHIEESGEVEIPVITIMDILAKIDVLTPEKIAAFRNTLKAKWREKFDVSPEEEQLKFVALHQFSENELFEFAKAHLFKDKHSVIGLHHLFGLLSALEEISSDPKYSNIQKRVREFRNAV